MGLLPTKPSLGEPSLPTSPPHSQPDKPGEALEGLRGETANPVVGEISRETHSLSTLIGCEGHACVGSGMKRKGLS